MPLFTLQRNYILRTTKGHTIGFKKGEPAWVPPMCIPDAVAIGALPADGSDAIVLPEEKAPPPVLTAEERREKIFEAFDDIISRNVRTEFTASGLPHAKRVSELVGFETLSGERDESWKAYMAKRAELAENPK